MKKINVLSHLSLVIITIILAFSCKKSPSVLLTGELKTWHTVTLTFSGPYSSEYDTINPFTDYRLNIEFSKGEEKIIVPGYFAADGEASETSAKSGDKWRAHFCPPSAGEWSYVTYFVTGKTIAVSEDAGTACYFDGLTGKFTVVNAEKSSADMRYRGRLVYTGESYLKYSGSNEYFIKGGTDSPENFLGYKDFDGTYYGGNNKTRSGEASPNSGMHYYEPHIKDWKEGDPQWKNGKGKGIIGALNYLSSKGVNSFYFLTLNILGDGEDVWPYTERNERYRFDCSKLDQWDILFSHADKLGIMMHFVLQETENECLLDAGYLDVQRKLYLRELMARFSHHLAITWNLGEEHNPAGFSPYGQTYQDTKKMADYIKATDPYNNFIVVHTHAGMEQRTKDMTAYLGFKNIEGPSIQCGNVNDVHEETKKWLTRSKDSLHQWVVCQDEIGQHWKGALPDAVDPAHDTIRYKVLWGNLMAGGGGVEWYFGYMFAHSDLSCEDFRSRDLLWDQTRIALDFFHNHLPFNEMISSDELTDDKDDYCFAKPGEIYVVYLPFGKATNITIDPGSYLVHWFNPRTGAFSTSDKLEKVSPGKISTGTPPVEDGTDWVWLLRNEPK